MQSPAIRSVFWLWLGKSCGTGEVGVGFSAGQNPKLVNLLEIDIGLGAGKIVWLTKHFILSGNTSIRT